MAEVAERQDPSTDPAAIRESRLDRLLKASAALSLDAALVTSDESIADLTGFRPTQLERFFGVVVRLDRSAVIVPTLDRGQIDGAPERLSRLSYVQNLTGSPSSRVRLPARGP